MDTPTTTLICPYCKKSIPIDQALSLEFSEKLKKEFEEKREKEREKERTEMLSWKEEQKKKILVENDLELKALKEESERKDQELKKSRESELELLNKEKILKEKLESSDLEVARRINEEADKIREETTKKIQEENRFRDADKDKKISDMLIQIEELKTKAQQGSQQLQGEVVELELEGILKQEFPVDEILPVPKGVRGADVIQKVKGSNGQDCGIIIWESKRTKNWTEGWLQKLKDDQRLAKADVAIIVSSVLPVGVRNFEIRDGIHIANFDVFIGLAKLVRSSLVELQKTKLSTVDKHSKQEIIYAYLSGNEFRQRVEAIVEAFKMMQRDLETDKIYKTKEWARREKQIQSVIDNSVGMYGDLQGLMGTSLPEIKSLDVENLLIQTGTDDHQ